MLLTRFYLKSAGKTKTAQRLIVLHFHYRINGEAIHFTYSTQVFVKTKEWNTRIQRIKGGDPVTLEKNAVLSRLAAHVEQIYYHHVATGILSELKKPTFKELLDKVTCRHVNQTSSNPTDFIQFAENYVKERSRAKEIAEKTTEGYLDCIEHVRAYAASIRKKHLAFEDIDQKFSQGFKKYCFAKNHSVNTVNKNLKRIRFFQNEAIEQGLTTSLAHKARRFQISKADTTEIYLSIEDLQCLYKVPLVGTQAVIRDGFIVEALTGVRFSDTDKLNRDTLTQIDGRNIFKFYTQKTGESVVIPVHSIALKICEKYNWSIPSYHNATLNQELKKIGKLAGLNDRFQKLSTAGGVKRYETKAKWQLIKTHTARRSFATNAYLAGLDLYAISKITGHRSIKSLLEYIKADSLASAKKIAGHEFFSSVEGW